MGSNRLLGGFRSGMGCRIRFFCCVWFALTTLDGMVWGSGFKATELTIETSEGNAVTLMVEMARTQDELSQGLMNRKSLPDGKGMIFIFEKDQVLSFWMKNTRIPLSIAFIAADGRILEIHDMQPLNLTPVYSSRSARFALEVPQSWFSRAGIAVGDRIMGTRDLLKRK